MPSRAPRRWRGGAMGTSRPTAKPHEGCAAMGHGRCARRVERGRRDTSVERGPRGAGREVRRPVGGGEGCAKVRVWVDAETVF